jgi:glucokinase
MAIKNSSRRRRDRAANTRARSKNSRSEIVIGVDIGATKVAAGVVNAKGQILRRNVAAMSSSGDAAAGLSSVIAAISGLIRAGNYEGKLTAIGMCAPGPLDPKRGVIVNPPNLPCWRNYPLVAEMRRHYHVPVALDNDGNAAALAEAKWGAGRGYRNVFYAGIGTGIGSGIVLSGHIYHGRTGAAGEGGHVGIDPDGPLCNCGKRGCIEALAAGPAIAARARRKLAERPDSLLLKMIRGNPAAITSEMVGKAYADGDAVARQVVEETLDALSYWLANIIDLLEPDVVVIGGGVSTMLEPFLDDIRNRIKGACINPSPEDIPLVIARYGEDSGIAGAAALCER